jgi:hypothetical protein
MNSIHWWHLQSARPHLVSGARGQLRVVVPLGLAALLGAAACTDSPESLDQQRQAALSDAVHGPEAGRVAGFYFLPPVVPRPALRGAFVPEVSPTVQIDRIDPATGATLRAIATFTRTRDHDGAAIRVRRQGERCEGDDEDGAVDDPNGYFWVRWRTRGLHLSTDAKYRIRVRVPGGRELGFADVRVVDRERDRRAIDRNEFVALRRDHDLVIRFRIDRPAVDGDGDGVFDWDDRCPTVANADQHDSVGDHVGDACRCLGVSCATSDACHVAGTCSPTTGLCSNPVAPDGTEPVRGTLRLPADTVTGTFPASPTGTDYEPTGSSWTYCQRPHGGEHAHLYRLQVTERIGVELDSDVRLVGARRTLKTIALRRACSGSASEFACEDWGDNDGDTYGWWPLLVRVLDPGEYVVALDGPAGSDYALAVRTFAPPLSADCATAPELAPGLPEGYSDTDTARGGPGATACDASATRPQHFYAVTIPPRHLAILRGSQRNFDSRLVLRAYEACGASRCLAASTSGLTSPSGTGARRVAYLAVDNAGDVPRRVIVGVSAARDAQSEAYFSFGVSSFAPLPTTAAPNASCDRATSVGNGSHLVGEDSRLATSAATCDSEAFQGRALYYRVTVPAGYLVVVRATPTGTPAISPHIRVLDACGATSCLASDALGLISGGNVLRHPNTSGEARTWIVTVGDSFASAGGVFDLDVSFETLPIPPP